MTAILCYGDSNTWGYAASTPDRLERWVRWPGVLQRELGDDVHVIEDGLSGRTTVFEDPFQPYRNGLAHLYRRVAVENPGVHLLDLGEHVTSSPLDGVHFEAADHRKIGTAVAGRIRELLDL